MTSKLILSLITVSVLFAAPVSAEETGASGGTLAACKTDVDTLCKDTGEGRGSFKCLRDNESKLSTECKAAIETHRTARRAVREACKADRDTLCKDAGEERGAGMKCLRENASKVSSACSAALAALPSRGKD